MSLETALTHEEGVKAASHLLRGHLGEDLADGARALSHPDSEHLIKFHGIYAQDDRDVRRERTLAKEELEYIFMVRVVVPGGRLTSAQWLALDDVAERFGNGTLRLTTRQAVQIHGVWKGSLRDLARRLHEATLSSFGGCGDVVRNTVLCPRLGEDPYYARLVTTIASHFRARTNAYLEVFVNGEIAVSVEDESEHDFYGVTYLPRKFKIAVAHPEENCVDVFAHDVGIIPTEHPTEGRGAHVLVGGGLGRSYQHPGTYARLAESLGFVREEDLVPVIQSLVEIYRDEGGRVDRRQARFKYVVAERGVDQIREEVVRRSGRVVVDAPAPLLAPGDDHLGWRPGSDGRSWLGLPVPRGRVRDAESSSLRGALRQIAETLDAQFVVTPRQDLRVGVAPELCAEIDRRVSGADVTSAEDLSPVARRAIACVALPTCSKALAESERVLPEVLAIVDGALTRVGRSNHPLEVRVSGCPNGCSRAALAEVALVGRTKTTYDLYLGASPRGDRLARLVAEKVSLDRLDATLAPWFTRWVEEGAPGESFGDFVARTDQP